LKIRKRILLNVFLVDIFIYVNIRF